MTPNEIKELIKLLEKLITKLDMDNMTALREAKDLLETLNNTN